MLGRDHALSGALVFAGVAPLVGVTGLHLAAGVALTMGAGVLPDIDEPGSTIARTFGFLTGAFAWIAHGLSGGHRKGTHSLIGVAALTAGAFWAASIQGSAWTAHGRLAHPWHLVPALVVLALLFSAGFRAVHLGGHHGDAAGVLLAGLVVWKGWDLDLITPPHWSLLTSWHVASTHVPVLAVCVALGMLAHIAGDMCTHDGCPLLYPFSRYEFGLLPEQMRITTNKLAEHWVVTPLLIAGLAFFAWQDYGHLLLATHGTLTGR
ncbi:MAG TPA: metal-dependent hydrolase [Streptosporangiaceae bacterium]|nr:metal-dependent hydrolase [Streptosporangiaceae bacterium]